MLERLTSKEQSIVKGVARGLTNREVADELALSHKTVEWALTRVYRKLGVRSRTELVLLLVEASRVRSRGFPLGPKKGRFEPWGR